MISKEYAKALGKVIRELRRKRRLTISDIHFQTHICHQSIRKLERGERYPYLDTVLAICQVLEVKPSILFTMAGL